MNKKLAVTRNIAKKGVISMRSSSPASISVYLDSDVLRNPFQAILPPFSNNAMKHTISILTIILTFQSFLFGQIDSSYIINKFKNITDMPYICEGEVNMPGCGQTAFWDVVMKKDSVIPILLSILDDTTKTLATVPNFGGNWTIGDVAYNALEEIIDGIPTFKLLGVKFDTKGCGYCSYWSHLRDDYKNRQAFEKKVSRWYYKNKSNLVWVQSNKTLTCDCRFNHPNGGHYELIR